MANIKHTKVIEKSRAPQRTAKLTARQPTVPASFVFEFIQFMIYNTSLSPLFLNLIFLTSSIQFLVVRTTEAAAIEKFVKPPIYFMC